MSDITTQAVEQLREKIEKLFADKIATNEPYLNKGWSLAKGEILSALADTLKIVGGDVIGEDEDTSKGLTKRSPAGTRTLNTRKRAWRNTLRAMQRQRLDLVVGEMKCK